MRQNDAEQRHRREDPNSEHGHERDHVADFLRSAPERQCQNERTKPTDREHGAEDSWQRGVNRSRPVLVAPPDMDVPVPVMKVMKVVRVMWSVHVLMLMRVHAAGYRQPTADHAKDDEEAAAGDLPGLLQPQWQLPPEQQNSGRAQGEKERMTRRKSQSQPECAAIPYGSNRRGRDRKRGDRHQVIGAQAMQEPERKNRKNEHAAVIIAGD